MKHGIHKSRSQFYWDLFECAYHDVVGALVSVSEQEKDLANARSRYYHEGIQFFTIVLPRYGKALDRALSNTDVPLRIDNFQKRKSTQLPLFLGGLLEYVFTADGVVRSAGPHDTSYCCETAASALRGLRQLLFMFYKLELPPTEDQINEVISNFKDTDAGIADGPRLEEKTLLNSSYPSVLRLARSLIHSVLCNADPLSGKPKHGPGVVATGERSSEKHRFSRFYRALARFYDYNDWFYYNAGHLAENLDDFLALEELEAGTAKVVLVPKDSRGPRLISCEPLEYQWIQQAQLSVLVEHIESHPLTRGLVNFTDQGVNRSLSLSSSLNEEMVTLDMKEASDRVALWHVEYLFPSNWVEALRASRSIATRLPSGEILPLKKFAPMGSAFCFPVEALVFWAVSTATLIVNDAKSTDNAFDLSLASRDPDRGSLGSQLDVKEGKNLIYRVLTRSGRDVFVPDPDSLERLVTPSLIRKRWPVYVYGDDLILRTDNHRLVVEALELVDFKVNMDKCCTNGPFRESCGCDAYKGIDVTPTRFRVVLDRHIGPNVFVRLVGFANEAYAKGMVGTSFWLEKQIRSLYRGWPLPVVSNDNPSCLALIRPGLLPTPGPNGKRRFNKHLHVAELLGLASQARTERAALDGYPLILREEYKREAISGQYLSSSPTGTYPIARRNKLKRAWTAML